MIYNQILNDFGGIVMNNPMAGTHVPFGGGFCGDNGMMLLLVLLLMNPGMFGDNMMMVLLLVMMFSGGKMF
jgi:hypothetical protein